jgi:hypothetical protein
MTWDNAFENDYVGSTAYGILFASDEEGGWITTPGPQIAVGSSHAWTPIGSYTALSSSDFGVHHHHLGIKHIISGSSNGGWDYQIDNRQNYYN